MITSYLEDLENRLNVTMEEELLTEWKAFVDDKRGSGVFAPKRSKSAPASLAWPKIFINDGLDDFELMALEQLSSCSSELEAGGGGILNVRPNYGVGILPTIFGADLFLMAREQNTLPTTYPLPGGIDTIQKTLEAGIPDLRTGYGKRCLEMGKYYVELFAPYPKIAKYVHIYHPDLQGPMDVCELLWGSDLFADLIEESGLVQALLDLITRTYAQMMGEWNRIVAPANYSSHWGMLHKGRIFLRDDSAMNLSPEMFETFIKPYDQRLLREFGGGAIHFCGKGDHFIQKLGEMEGVYAVNLTQPQYNNMEIIFRNTIDKGIMLLGLPRAAAEEALQHGRDLRGRVHISQ